MNSQKKDKWHRVEKICAGIAPENDTVLLQKKLAEKLRAANLEIRENIALPAYFRGSQVSTFPCPILVENTGAIFPVAQLPEMTLARRRLENYRETLGLEAAFYTDSQGNVFSEIHKN